MHGVWTNSRNEMEQNGMELRTKTWNGIVTCTHENQQSCPVTARFGSCHFSLAKSFSSIMAVYVFSARNEGTEYPNFLQNRLTLPPMQPDSLKAGFS